VEHDASKRRRREQRIDDQQPWSTFKVISIFALTN
jgi:hypothetical protein